MVVILYATEMEAAPLLERVNAQPSECGGFRVYRFTPPGSPEECALIISGMGKQHAASAAEAALAGFEVSRVINAGICGALEDGVDRGAIFRVDRVGDGDNPAAGKTYELTHPKCSRWGDIPFRTLLSVTTPVMDPERRAELAAFGAIVDMEGFAVAQVCISRSTPLTMLKGVSDMADNQGKSDIIKNLTGVSTRLAELIIEELPCKPAERNIIIKLMNFVKFEHTVFSLPLIFSGAWLGAGGSMPGFRVLILTLLAGAGGRTLGMAMNRIFDRHLDALNKRTRNRELPAGKLNLMQACTAAAAGFIVYMAACAGLGGICLKLSFIPLIPLIGYSLLKRFTSWCHFGIGICLALAPLCAYIAASGGVAFNKEILLLSLFTFCWISGYDIIYALQDLESDLKTGVQSMPVRLGSTGAQVLAGVVHAIAAAALIRLWLTMGATNGALAALITAVAALGCSYVQRLPLHLRFFPASAIAGIAGAALPVLGELL